MILRESLCLVKKFQDFPSIIRLDIAWELA